MVSFLFSITRAWLNPDRTELVCRHVFPSGEFQDSWYAVEDVREWGINPREVIQDPESFLLFYDTGNDERPGQDCILRKRDAKEYRCTWYNPQIEVVMEEEANF